MNNLRLLTGLLGAVLLSAGVYAHAQTSSVITLEELFESAEANSLQLRPSFSAEKEAEHEISVARAGRLPDINAALSLSYIGDGFTKNSRLSRKASNSLTATTRPSSPVIPPIWL